MTGAMSTLVGTPALASFADGGQPGMAGPRHAAPSRFANSASSEVTPMWTETGVIRRQPRKRRRYPRVYQVVLRHQPDGIAKTRPTLRDNAASA